MFHLVHGQISEQIPDPILSIDIFWCVIRLYTSNFDIADVLHRLNDGEYKATNVVSDSIESGPNRRDICTSSFPKASIVWSGLGLVSLSLWIPIHPFEEVRVV